MSVATISGLIGIASTIIGGAISLVILGIKVGKITSKVEELDSDNFRFGENNRQKFNEMEKQDFEHSQTIALLKKSIEDISSSLLEIKEELKTLNAYVRHAEVDRTALESRITYLEKEKCQ